MHLRYSPMSLIVPHDVDCTLRFAVGQRFCVATLRFAKDDDAVDVVRKFLQEESIPVYLHESIYSTVKSMIWEEVTSTIRESENSALFIKIDSLDHFCSLFTSWRVFGRLLAARSLRILFGFLS